MVAADFERFEHLGFEYPRVDHCQRYLKLAIGVDNRIR
jgi:hypothetical protein